MNNLKDICKIAVVQASPVMFDAGACTDKAVELIERASRKEKDGSHAELIVFPELFIPGYPYGMTFGFTVGRRKEEGRKDWKIYYDNSIVIPGPETKKMGAVSYTHLDVYKRQVYRQDAGS